LSKRSLINNEGVKLGKAHANRYRKRYKPLCSDDNDMTFTMAFTRAWIDYIHSKGYSIASVCREINKLGEIKLSQSVVDGMSTGTNKRYVYLYKLQLMAEYVGLNLMDFVTIRQPHLERSKDDEDV
jgi:hypothetical protein